MKVNVKNWDIVEEDSFSSSFFKVVLDKTKETVTAPKIIDVKLSDIVKDNPNDTFANIKVVVKENGKYINQQSDQDVGGKWMVDFSWENQKSEITGDELWEKAKKLAINGDIGNTKITLPTNDATSKYKNGVLIVYVEDEKNLKEIVRIHNVLLNNGLIQKDDVINFKTNKATVENTNDILYTSKDIINLKNTINEVAEVTGQKTKNL